MGCRSLQGASRNAQPSGSRLRNPFSLPAHLLDRLLIDLSLASQPVRYESHRHPGKPGWHPGSPRARRPQPTASAPHDLRPQQTGATSFVIGRAGATLSVPLRPRLRGSGAVCGSFAFAQSGKLTWGRGPASAPLLLGTVYSLLAGWSIVSGSHENRGWPSDIWLL